MRVVILAQIMNSLTKFNTPIKVRVEPSKTLLGIDRISSFGVCSVCCPFVFQAITYGAEAKNPLLSAKRCSLTIAPERLLNLAVGVSLFLAFALLEVLLALCERDGTLDQVLVPL